MLHKALPAALFATLALTGCNTTGAPKPPLQLSPAQEEKLLTLVATKFEGSVDAGVVVAYPFKTASVSKPFWRDLPLQDKPAIGYCVFFEPDMLLAQPTSAMADVIERENGTSSVLLTIRRGITAKAQCDNLEMRPFPKLIELRNKRREARGPAPESSLTPNR